MEATIAFLLAHRLVRRVEVFEEAHSLESSFLAVKVTLRDGSVLFVRERLRAKLRMYSYHWQDRRGKLRIRWDNSLHHRTIPTFPHHKHVGSSRRVAPSDETTLAAVLVAVEEQFEHLR